MAWIDNELDIRALASDDAALRAYITARVLPPLNVWLTANSGRFANGLTFGPVSSEPVPTAALVYDRLAARLPQWVQITVVNGVPVASLR